MRFVLNEFTQTIHKHEVGKSDLQTVCGATYHVNPDHLQLTTTDPVATDRNTSKCGRCFEEAGGY